MQNKKKELLNKEYLSIRKDCAIIIACSRDYYHRLIALLVSIKKVFVNHPKIIIFDLGLGNFQKKELEGIENVCVKNIPKFVSHWNLCFTWKFYTMLNASENIILYLDAGNIALKNFQNLFLSIKKNDYFLASQDGLYKDITPIEYINLVSLDKSMFLESQIFAGGIIGFKKNTKFYDAIIKSYKLACEGYTLGYSSQETHRIKNDKENIIRNCFLFRHDMTILGLCVYEVLSSKVLVRNGHKYCGWTRGVIKKNQIFYNHRNDISFIKYNLIFNISTNWISYLINRSIFILKYLKIFFKTLK